MLLILGINKINQGKNKMAQISLFGGGQLSTSDAKQADISTYQGPVYVLKQSKWKPFGKTDIRVGEAHKFMDGIAAQVKSFYDKRDQVIIIGDYSYEFEASRLSLYRGSSDFLSLVHRPPGESGRRGTISIQVDVASAEPNVDADVKELLKALGAKL